MASPLYDQDTDMTTEDADTERAEARARSMARHPGGARARAEAEQARRPAPKPTGLTHPYARLAGSASVWDANVGARSASAPTVARQLAGDHTNARAAYAEGLLTGAVRVFAAAHNLAEPDVYAWLAR